MFLLLDIKLSNLMFQVEDESIFPDYEEAEKESPSERKVINEERSIYSSRRFRQPRAHAYGLPVLCDFGEARIGSSHPWANIQPEVYRAPEILMQFEHYDCAIDIWNVGCVASFGRILSLWSHVLMWQSAVEHARSGPSARRH